MEIRDRVVELRRVRARDLLPNPKNWRRHPKVQADALRGLLDEIGIADALLARELPDGRLQLIDGHLRAETMPDEEVPVSSSISMRQRGRPTAAHAWTRWPPWPRPTISASMICWKQFDRTIQRVLALLDEIRAKEGLLLQELRDLADPEPQIDKARL